MQRNTKRVIAAVAVIALLAAGGAAFTSQITGLDGQNAAIGYGAETVNGATATDVKYQLSPDGQYIDQVVVTLTGDQTASTFTAALTGETVGQTPNTAVDQAPTLCWAGS